MSKVFNLKLSYGQLTWIVLTLAVMMRLPHLAGSFWLDEAAQALESVRPLSQQLEIAEDFQPPLLHLLLHLASRVSHSEWWLRTIGALIPGVLTIWATIKIGGKLHHPKTGLLAGLLLTLNPFHIFYSQELRPYSLPALFAALSWLELLSWKTGVKWGPSWWLPTPHKSRVILFALLSLAGLYSSYLYPFLLLSQLVYTALWRRHHLGPLLVALGVAVVGFLPWLPFLLEQLTVGSALRQQLPGWDQVVSLPQLKALPLVFAKFIFGIAPLSADIFTITSTLFLGVCLGGLIALLWQRKKLQSSALPLVVWITVPLLTAWIVSFTIPVIQPKRVLFLLPPLLLVLSAHVSRYLYTKPLLAPNFFTRFKTNQGALTSHLLGVASLALLIGISLTGTWRYYQETTLQREDWRAVFTTITSSYPADTTIVLFSFPEPFAPWRWYEAEFLRAGGSVAKVPQALATGVLKVDVSQPLPEKVLATLTTLPESGRVITFDYLTDLTDPEQLIPALLSLHGFKNTDVLEYPNIGFVRIYERRD